MLNQVVFFRKPVKSDLLNDLANMTVRISKYDSLNISNGIFSGKVVGVHDEYLEIMVMETAQTRNFLCYDDTFEQNNF